MIAIKLHSHIAHFWTNRYCVVTIYWAPLYDVDIMLFKLQLENEDDVDDDDDMDDDVDNVEEEWRLTEYVNSMSIMKL